MKYTTHTGAVVNLIDHAMWPTPVPYSTFYWTQADFDKQAEFYRPEGYTGGLHDQEAYNLWLSQKKDKVDVG